MMNILIFIKKSRPNLDNWFEIDYRKIKKSNPDKLLPTYFYMFSLVDSHPKRLRYIHPFYESWLISSDLQSIVQSLHL